MNGRHFLPVVTDSVIKGILCNAVGLLLGDYLQALHHTRHALHRREAGLSQSHQSDAHLVTPKYVTHNVTLEVHPRMCTHVLPNCIIHNASHPKRIVWHVTLTTCDMYVTYVTYVSCHVSHITSMSHKRNALFTPKGCYVMSDQKYVCPIQWHTQMTLQKYVTQYVTCNMTCHTVSPCYNWLQPVWSSKSSPPRETSRTSCSKPLYSPSVFSRMIAMSIPTCLQGQQ